MIWVGVNKPFNELNNKVNLSIVPPFNSIRLFGRSNSVLFFFFFCIFETIWKEIKHSDCEKQSFSWKFVAFLFMHTHMRCNVCEYAMREYEPLLASVLAFFLNPHLHPHGTHSFELLFKIWYSRMSNRNCMRYCWWWPLMNMSMWEFSVNLFRLRCLCAKVVGFF